MRKDHRPYFVKKARLRFEKFYVRRFLQPQFDSLGRGYAFMRPWFVELFGAPITLGDYATVIATADRRVRLSVWPARPGGGCIAIGRWSLICPGVRIGSAASVEVGDSCMLASNAYLTDCDWHDAYDRLAIGRSAPVVLEENVWVGDSAIVCKGVRIGRNSIIGAGAVVTRDIPANVVAAGNPAQVVRELDPSQPLVTRAALFANPLRLAADFDLLDRARLEPNTIGHWVRSLIAPGPTD
jgi:acetyltransferase-like isoleucine patch superfamily enzyme